MLSTDAEHLVCISTVFRPVLGTRPFFGFTTSDNVIWGLRDKAIHFWPLYSIIRDDSTIQQWSHHKLLITTQYIRQNMIVMCIDAL